MVTVDDLRTRTHANVQVYRRPSANVRVRRRRGGVRLRVRAYNSYARAVGQVRPHGRLRTRAHGARTCANAYARTAATYALALAHAGVRTHSHASVRAYIRKRAHTKPPTCVWEVTVAYVRTRALTICRWASPPIAHVPASVRRQACGGVRARAGANVWAYTYVRRCTRTWAAYLAHVPIHARTRAQARAGTRTPTSAHATAPYVPPRT